MPGGELPKLAEYERPAPAASRGAAVMPPTFVPSGGFASLARTSAPNLRADPLAPPLVRRLVASALIQLHTAVIVLIAVLSVDRYFLARALDRGELRLHDADVSDRLLRIGLGAYSMVGGATALAILVWTFATVRRAARRYPMGRHYPSIAVLTWFIPIAWMWLPWTRLRRASQCEGGGGAEGLQLWQLLWLVDNLLGLAWTGAYLRYKSNDLFGYALDLVIWGSMAAAHVALCFAALRAMHHVDAATCGLDLHDSATPAPATA